MTTFGDKIRKLRKEKKMTQQKLGDMVGVSHRTIRSWEVEGRYPKQSSLYQKPQMHLNITVLPEPLNPMIPWIFPASKV